MRYFHRVRCARACAGIALAVLFSILAGCAVRLIADYDEFTFNKVALLQEQCETLFVALEEAAITPDPDDDLYSAHAPAYAAIIVSLRVLDTRAQTIAQNEITTEQVQLLRDSLEKMQALHRRKSSQTPPQGLSLEAVQAVREPVVQQFRAILTLQEALRRGESS